MSEPTMTDEDVRRAERIWRDYQQTHDVSHRKGEAVGIDPASGRVWFGESALGVVDTMRADGTDAPLFFLRVGYDYYCRKGGRR